MNILAEIRSRFRTALETIIDDPDSVLDMIRPSQNPQFGDYQANCAMPLKGRLKKDSREIAQQIIDGLQIDDMCETPEIAGPGFINLKLKNKWLQCQVKRAGNDERLSVTKVVRPKTYVVDYSSPNVAKPMHVGHIRTTVIGDSICRTLRFLGHQVISDNHLGDWGTQFGMIIYGYRNFANQEAYHQAPVEELSRIYRLVRQIMDYHENVAALPKTEQQIVDLRERITQAKKEPSTGDQKADKKAAKAIKRLEEQLTELTKDKGTLESIQTKIAAVEANADLCELTKQHADISDAALEETAKLHAGDKENLKLWHEFLPKCREDIQKIYDRLDVSFDYELGESYYHDRLGAVVDSLKEKGLAKESEGAVCVFMDEFDTPMIIQKKDGAFLYATTDLATIQYRMEEWEPDAILYVVDFRQSEHFEKLFAAVRLWGFDAVDLRHIKFGTVLGPDGKPYKTREGDTVGLEGLLDQAVAKSLQVVCENDDAKLDGPELSEQERAEIANTIGHAAIKYADLSHNRASDYVYHEDKMVALKGNTATYLQYSFARCEAIFNRPEVRDVDINDLWPSDHAISVETEKERALALYLLRFSEAIEDALVDFEPNQLTNYLYELAQLFSGFYNDCKVVQAETKELRDSRLMLCDLVRRTVKLGLSLLGIHTVHRM